MGEGEKLSKNQLSLRAKRGNPRLTEVVKILCVKWSVLARSLPRGLVLLSWHKRNKKSRRKKPSTHRPAPGPVFRGAFARFLKAPVILSSAQNDKVEMIFCISDRSGYRLVAKACVVWTHSTGRRQRPRHFRFVYSPRHRFACRPSLSLRDKEGRKKFCPLCRLRKRGQLKRLSENRVSKHANAFCALLFCLSPFPNFQ